MLAAVGYITVILCLVAIMSKKVTPFTAFTLIPAFACIVIGQGANIGSYIASGITSIASIGVMFTFSMVFFGMMSDVGAFDVPINFVLKRVGTDPVKICIGALIVTCITHLDGSGATTFLITIPAMKPIFDRMKMDIRVLATIAALGAGTMNTLPWGGAVIRAAASLGIEMDAIFTPLIVPMIAALLACLGVSVILGLGERKRLGYNPAKMDAGILELEISEDQQALRRPKLLWINWILIIVTIVCLVMNLLPPAPCFILATVLCLIVNFPSLDLQRKVVDSHAKDMIWAINLLWAAGCYSGMLKNSGILEAMAQSLVNIIPQSLGGQLPLLLGLMGTPLNLFFDGDSFFYGVLPVLAETGAAFGVSPIILSRAVIAGGFWTVGFPITPLASSNFILTGLCGIDIGEHQKRTFLWAWAVGLIFLLAAIIVGAVPL